MSLASRVRSLFKASSPVPGVTDVPDAWRGGGGSTGTSWWGIVKESFSGAWQRNIEIDSTENVLAFSAVYACVTLIAADIAKLRIKLMQLNAATGIWKEVTNAAFSPVLRKPNNYQTRIQFLENWVSSKLIHGNTYVLKERNGANKVVALHVLNPRMVRAMVAVNGDVYYQISMNLLAQTQSVLAPASEVIHDRAICFYHPLVGVGPIYACGMSASQGNRIQGNSAKFFENMSRPSGQLTAPGTIPDETAKRLKQDFEANFSGANIGRLLVTGDNLKYEPMTIPAQQAQLIEQLAWTVNDVARCFHVPLHKIGSDAGVKYANMSAMNQDYYCQTLQIHIESIELLLDEGLALTSDGSPQTYGVELDLEGLLRMDPTERATRNSTAIKAGYLAPNEARATDNLPPVDGGAEPMMQVQNFPLSVLAKIPPPTSVPTVANPTATPGPAPAPQPTGPAADDEPAGDDSDAGKAVVALSTAVDDVSAKQLELELRFESELARVEEERRVSADQLAERLAAEEASRVEAERVAAEAAAERERARDEIQRQALDDMAVRQEEIRKIMGVLLTESRETRDEIAAQIRREQPGEEEKFLEECRALSHAVISRFADAAHGT